MACNVRKWAFHMLVATALVSIVLYRSFEVITKLNLPLLSVLGWNSTDFLSNDNSSKGFDCEYDDQLHLYTVKGKPILWLYWDHNPMPPYIQLSLETIKCHSSDEVHIELVNAELAKTLIADVPEEVSWLIPAHQADYFRSSILMKYGGMYMDADTIQTGSVRHLFDKLKDFDVYGCNWPPEEAPISITNVGPMRTGNILVQKWKPIADGILKDKHNELMLNFIRNGSSYPIQWAELLGSIWIPLMRDLLRNHQINYTYVDGPKTYGQMVVNGLLSELFQPISITTATEAKNLNFNVEYLYYHNSGQQQELKQMQMEIFLANRFLFTEIIRKAISQCEAWQQGYYDSPLVRKLDIKTFNNFAVPLQQMNSREFSAES